MEMERRLSINSRPHSGHELRMAGRASVLAFIEFMSIGPPLSHWSEYSGAGTVYIASGRYRTGRLLLTTTIQYFRYTVYDVNELTSFHDVTHTHRCYYMLIL